jgi:hypothetical protein
MNEAAQKIELDLSDVAWRVGHVDTARASQIGMPRAYGYGATMGAWVTDYVAFWAGHEGFVRYSNTASEARPTRAT